MREAIDKEYRLEQFFEDSIWYLWKHNEVVKTGDLSTILDFIRKENGDANERTA